MKRLFIILLLALPMLVLANGKGKRDDTKYLAGAVPTDANGIVTFKQSFAAPGKSAAEVYDIMQAYTDGIERAAIHDMRTKYMEKNAADGQIVLRCEEWMVFKKRFLNLDRTRFRYHFQVKCSAGRCDMVITQISYYYEEQTDGTGGKTYKAEEWISDKEAINKKGDKLYPGSAKFRRKTVDRVDELFEGARQAFEEPEEKKETKRSTQLIKE